MTTLADQHAAPDGTAPQLTDDETQNLLRELPEWSIENGKLARDVQVKNFKEALALVNRIGDLAEQENHHPDICIHSWNHVKIELYTHTAHGVSRNDFILAAKCDRLIGGGS